MKNLKNYVYVLVLIILSSSCAYNKNFLQPTKYNETTKSITANKTKTDSTVVKYNGKPYQPNIIKNGTDTLTFNYTIESVIFKNSDNVNLNGWMMKPKNNQNITKTILHFHGNTGSLLGQFGAIKPLLEKGFQIFVFDYSGFGFSEGEATRANLLTDGIAAVDYLKTRSDVKNTKLILYGQSYGGHLSICVASKTQDKIDLIVAEGSFSNHDDLSSQGVSKFFGFMSRIFVREIYAATDEIKKIKKPILLIHSSEDKVIPFWMGEKLFQNAKEPKRFLQLTGKHLEATTNNLDEVATAITDMLKK